MNGNCCDTSGNFWNVLSDVYEVIHLVVLRTINDDVADWVGCSCPPKEPVDCVLILMIWGSLGSDISAGHADLGWWWNWGRLWGSHGCLLSSSLFLE